MSYEPGAPVDGMVPLSVPTLRGNEWRYIKDCLDGGWVSSVGEYVTRFESMVADYVGTRFAIATVNGTAALHIALVVAGVEANDFVLVSDLTFIAPANAIRYVGADPVFIDAEPDFWEMDVSKAREYLERECVLHDGVCTHIKTGRTVRAILPVHILGHPVDMDPLLQLAEEFRLVVIEDATEALGTKYRNQFAGNLGQIACFSFNGNKLITTGGGGMLVTNDESLAKRARYLTTQAKDDTVEYIHGETGFNYRLTNVLAAMGCAQMEQLDDYIRTKRETAAYYDETLGDIPGITVMKQAPWAFSTFWLYTILIDAQEYGITSRALLQKLTAAKIQSRPLWQPLHSSPVFADLANPPCPVSETLNRDALSIPCSVGITPEQRELVARTIAAR
jgi:perosamine synthetase